jgi:hypothetical protein
VVDQVVSSVADPLVGMTRPALRTVLELDPRYLGLRPATADFPVDPEPTTTLATAPTLAPAPAEATAAGRGAAATTTADDDAASARAAGPGAAVVEAPAAAEGPTPAPSGRSFPGAFPQRAVVMTQGSPDSSQRSQRMMAVLSSSSGQPEPRTTALWRTPVESPLARFGGRPPVTPD